jgi:hypothetical protein
LKTRHHLGFGQSPAGSLVRPGFCPAFSTPAPSDTLDRSHYFRGIGRFRPIPFRLCLAAPTTPPANARAARATGCGLSRRKRRFPRAGPLPPACPRREAGPATGLTRNSFRSWLVPPAARCNRRPRPAL